MLLLIVCDSFHCPLGIVLWLIMARYMAEVLSRVMKMIGLGTENWKVPLCAYGHIENCIISDFRTRCASDKGISIL